MGNRRRIPLALAFAAIIATEVASRFWIEHRMDLLSEKVDRVTADLIERILTMAVLEDVELEEVTDFIRWRPPSRPPASGPPPPLVSKSRSARSSYPRRPPATAQDSVPPPVTPNTATWPAAPAVGFP